MAAQKPLLLRGGLTGAVYVLTRYKITPSGIEAIEKHDITDQFNKLVRETASPTTGKDS